MYGQICDCCEERRASYKINKIVVRTDRDAGTAETTSRNEDWCEECVKHHLDYWDETEPKVGDTWTEEGTWFQSKRGGIHNATYAIEDAPRPANWRLVPACPCCGEEYTADHVCGGCNNPEHSHA
ncbi:MAG: hypothetical protein ABSG53_26750 [Thermoguttaceae bacterium]|jgi:hypothetical protein